MKKELPPLNIEMPEGYIIDRALGYGGDKIHYDVKKFDPRYPLRLQQSLGGFTSYLSDFNPDELITMSSQIEPEAQRKGIARQIYKQAELDTGKKILPDRMLSDMSMPLHAKYGLGNEFGLSDYEEVIKRGLMKNANIYNATEAGKLAEVGSPFSGYELREMPPLWPEEYANKEYGKLKNLFNKIGLDKFKSIAPVLGPAAAIAGGLGYSDLAGAATDAIIPGGIEEMGVSPEQAELDRKYKERIRKFSKGK
jgi:hypothetical protein